MIRKILPGIGLFIIVIVGAAAYLMYRYESKLNREAAQQLKKLQPRVTTGDGEFTKRAFYTSSDLGEITQILVGWPAGREGAALTLVGKNGVHFLDAKAALKKKITFSQPLAAPLEVVRLDTSGDYGFLTRDQSWAVDAILFDKSGKEVWKYPGGVMNGVDDSTAGEVGEDRESTFVIGFNGRGGLVAVNSNGKKIWQKPEGNVWHIETLDIKGDGQREILHTNARGELLVRTETGEAIAHYLPGYYVSYFSLTRWANETQPTHVLVPTKESKQGCCKNVLLVLDSTGKTVADWDAPEGDWIHRTKGTSVHQGKTAALYAVLQTGLLPRSLLSVLNSDGKIIYQEVLGDRCLAMNTIPGAAADRLLIGCTNAVREYSRSQH